MKIFKIESGPLSKWLAIVFVAAAVVSGLALLASGLPRAIRNDEPWPRMEVRPGKDLSFDISEDFPGAGVSELNAGFSFESVDIVLSKDDDFHVHYEGAARNIDDWQEVFSADLAGGVLSVESHWRSVTPLGSVQARIEVPATFGGTLKVHSSSGRLAIDGVSGDVIDLSLSSGSLDALNLEADTLSLRSSSGRVSLESLKAGEMTLRASSGSITGTGLSADRIDVRNTSGRISLKGLSGSLELDASSGSADLEFDKPGDLIDIKMSSGRIDLGLPADHEFYLDASTSSGRLTSDFPVSVTGSLARNRLEGSVGDAGSKQVKLRSSSGSISLKQL